MNSRFKNQGKPILVAVKFDEHAPTLIKYGAELARRFGTSLQIINVQEKHPSYAAPYCIPALQDLVSALETEHTRNAEFSLKELQEEHAIDMPCHLEVINGYAPQAIMEQAIRSNASLIISGTSAGSHRFIPKGFSTALTLMAESPVPTLVIPFGCKVKLEKNTNNIIFSDDLNARTEPAAHMGIELAAAIGRAHFHHTHINVLTTEVLEASLVAALATSKMQSSSLTGKDLHAQILATINTKLHERAGEWRGLLEESGGKYIAIAEQGEVRSALTNLVEKIRPALVIFGRHHTFHHRPFLIGHLPFYAMMELHVPILIAPEDRY